MEGKELVPVKVLNMAKVRKVGITNGIHSAPAGKVHVTPSRMRHWVDSVKTMLKDMKIPVPWGHQPKALPADAEKTKADTEYWQSKYNAGYLEDVDINKQGQLEFLMDIPGCNLDDKGNLVSTADGKPVVISEVSAAIKPEFVDGKTALGKMPSFTSP